MDGSSDLEGCDALPTHAKESQAFCSTCVVQANAAAATTSQQRRNSLGASTASGEPPCTTCEGMHEGRQYVGRHFSSVARSRRASVAQVNVKPGEVLRSENPTYPCVSPEGPLARSCRRREGLSPAAAPCDIAAPPATNVAAAVLPFHRLPIESVRWKVPGPRSPLRVLSSSIHSSCNSGSEASIDVCAALARELTCPICLELFRLPVTVVCGHSFCRYCIGHKKLSRKACPLCRQDIGESFAVNTVLCNLLACFVSERQQNQQHRRHGSPISFELSVHAHSPVDAAWWAQNCVKQKVAAPLALRLLLPDVAEESGLLLDDLVACVLDAFDRKSLWAEQRWCFTLRDAETFCHMVGFDQQDREATRERLHRWVESYVSAHPSVCFRNGASGGDTGGPRFVVRVIGDRVHRIESQVFDSHTIQQGLPWDLGRHQNSLLHVPHSSVSLSHLLLLRERRDGCLRIVDLGSTIGTMVKVAGVQALQSGDLIHIGDRVEVSVEIYPAPSTGRRRRREAGEKELAGGGDRSALARVRGCPYLLSQWNPALGKVVGPVLLHPLDGTVCQPSDDPEITDAAAAGAGDVIWDVRSPYANMEQHPRETWHSTENRCNKGPHSFKTAGEGAAEEGGTAAAYTQQCNSISGQVYSPLSHSREDSQRTTIEGTLEGEDDPAALEPVTSFLLLKIHGSGRQEPREVWADPRGVLLGRGPQNSTADLKKLSVTASNGYVSRQHCLVYYDVQQPADSRWMLKDVSTLGTFIRLKPLQPYPCSVNPRGVFKVGQCKIEVAPWTLQQQQSQSAPVDAPSQSLLRPWRIPSPLTAIPTREHLRDLTQELDRQEGTQTPPAGLIADGLELNRMHTESQLPSVHTSFPVFLPWHRTGSRGPQQAQGQATQEFMHWRIFGSENESLYHTQNPDNLAPAVQPLLREGDLELRPREHESDAWQAAYPQQLQQSCGSTAPLRLEHIEAHLPDLALGCSRRSLANLPEHALSSLVNLQGNEGASCPSAHMAIRDRSSLGTTRGNTPPPSAEFDEAAATVNELMRCLSNCQLPQHTEIPHRIAFISPQVPSSDYLESSGASVQRPQHGRNRGSGSLLAREMSDLGNTAAVPCEPPGHEVLCNALNMQAGFEGQPSCAAPEHYQGSVGGLQCHLNTSDAFSGTFTRVGAELPRSSGSLIGIAGGIFPDPESLVGHQEPPGRQRQRSSWDILNEGNDVSYRS